MFLAQWPKEIVDQCEKADLDYMQHLKDSIDHFKKRIAINTFNVGMREHCKDMVTMLKAELFECEKDYLNVYGTKVVYRQGTDRKVSGQPGSKN